MEKTAIRRERQLAFLRSGKDLEVGSVDKLPISIDEIQNITKDSLCVMEYFESGLTAEVFKIEIDGKLYNLKKKRNSILVKNIDGQTSFLNEIQRRKDFEEARVYNEILNKGIVKTIYASLCKGFILSEWIEGNHIESYSRSIFSKLFKLLINIEAIGIFEWDLSAGNLILDADGEVRLFDFGYAYRFDPLTEFNSEGKTQTLFHCVERFETRTFMQYLLDMEAIKNNEDVLDLYRVEKQEAIAAYTEKVKWLKEQNANHDIIENTNRIIKRWEVFLKNEGLLKNLYDLERFRSYILDIHDDISGQSCTTKTLVKLEEVMKIIKAKHTFLRVYEGYLWDDANLKLEELIAKYGKMKEQVLAYQI